MSVDATTKSQLTLAVVAVVSAAGDTLVAWDDGHSGRVRDSKKQKMARREFATAG